MKHPVAPRDPRSPTSLAVAIALAIAGITAGCSSAAEGGASGFVGAGGGGGGGTTAEGGAGGGIGAPPLTATGLAVGAHHSCALLQTGQIACWGDGDLGQLGDGVAGKDYHRPYAAIVPGIVDAVLVRAGGDTTCALVKSGAAYCWGDGAYGQLGDGTAKEGYFQPAPVAVKDLADAIDLSVSSSGACAVVSDGTVRCWGKNSPKQLLGFESADCGPYTVEVNGTNTLVTYPCEPAPKVVSGASDVISVATGGEHTCAVTKSGSALCWGADNFGQLGDGLSGPDAHQTSPILIKGIDKASLLALGASHTCAVSGDNQAVSCWGDNSFGQLGNGTKALDSYKTTPADTTGLSHVRDLDAAGNVTCAVDGTGDVSCWGDTTYLFDAMGMPADPALYPTPAPGVVSALRVRIGASHACALLAGGSVVCWGLNDRGQVGNGTMGLGDYSLMPVAAPF
jgi:alpha-tubulin suppressor-like RCC1 family protein